MSDITDSTDIEAYQGNIVTKTFTFADTFDLSGKTFTVEAKRRRGMADTLFEIDCTVSSQIATLVIPATTTAALPRISTYELKDDASISYVTGKIHTRRRV